ncbi:MAG TPA: addiction module protein [Chitinophagaceae bacterium]|nr:addiction module protein [Chitinophagaceae bacterium]
MAVDLETLLALPQKQRRKIAEKLWDSLSPNNSISSETKEIIDVLETRRNKIETGKTKLYSSNQLK